MEQDEKILISAPDSFLTNTCCVGNAVGVVIPKRLLLYLGLRKKEKVKIWIKKVNQ